MTHYGPRKSKRSSGGHYAALQAVLKERHEEAHPDGYAAEQAVPGDGDCSIENSYTARQAAHTDVGVIPSREGHCHANSGLALSDW
jgi:hypothetical protein